MVWNYLDPLFEVFTTFNADMDTATIPPAANFSIEVDGVPKTPDAVNWLSARCMRAYYSEAALNPAAARFLFPAIHDDLKYATGQQHGTWAQTGTRQTYDPEYDIDGQDLTVSVGIDPDNNDAVDPTPSNFELEDNNTAFTPDSVEYDDVNVVEMEKAWGAAIVAPIRAEYESFDIRMITATGLFTPYFNLENIPEGG